MPEPIPAVPSIPTRQLKQAGSTLRDCLDKSRTMGCLGPFVFGVAQVLESFGIKADRVNPNQPQALISNGGL